ncbi:MAG: murein L,D-transpeptidase [Proteobacteria bacterium]|nr:murein L,D-transpeptidase [Pseudomonadota bacterium]
MRVGEEGTTSPTRGDDTVCLEGEGKAGLNSTSSSGLSGASTTGNLTPESLRGGLSAITMLRTAAVVGAIVAGTVTSGPVQAASAFTPASEASSVSTALTSRNKADLVGALIQRATRQETPTNHVDLHAHPLQRGSQGPVVERLTSALSKWVPGVKVTPAYDEQTEQAVRSFQQANHLPTTGRVDNTTFGVLWNRTFWEKGQTVDLNDPSFYRAIPSKVVLKADLTKHQVELRDASSNRLIKTYPFSNGRAGNSTPKGTFTIGQVREKPTWFPPASSWARNAHVVKPGPHNPLGPAALRLGQSDILFHGVPQNEWSSIGKSAQSHGCMRMFPHDAWELHKIIPVGTQVEVR